jgi:DNA-binding SARP family transcriptional activator
LVQWTTIQSRDLFFCLLQHRHGLRKEELGNIFWPDHPPRKLDGIFRSTLYRLRRAVYRDAVIFEDGRYSFRWDCDYWLDIEAFEQSLAKAEASADPKEQLVALQAALDLYQGDYLEGVYDDWSSLERQRLREKYLAALETVAGLHAGRGSLQQAVEEYQHLVVADPYREPAHRELMRCYYRLGDRAAAIRQYQSCVKLLREELGLSPSHETEELYLQIID